MTLFLTEAANGRDESFVEAAPRTRAEMEQRVQIKSSPE